jgi:hypothetical protein
MDTKDSQATSSDVSGVTASSSTNTYTSGFSSVIRYMLIFASVKRPSWIVIDYMYDNWFIQCKEHVIERLAKRVGCLGIKSTGL